MRVLAVGTATLDMIDTLETYPVEDTEQRALSRRVCLGGNAANTLNVLCQLGHACSWAGTLAGDAAGRQTAAELERRGIDIRWAELHPQGTAPLSHILHSCASGSRTIVHYRELPEFSAGSFARIDPSRFDWLHFEARNIPDCAEMLRRARRAGCRNRISLEVEKPREGIEALFPLADVLLFSRAYAVARGHAEDPRELFATVRRSNPGATLYAAWGAAGAWLQRGPGPALHLPPHRPPQVVDTLGAGDVFNAGVIHGTLRGRTPEETLGQAIELAGEKCGRPGLDGLVSGRAPVTPPRVTRPGGVP